MNFYSEMFNMKLPNGEGLFNTLEVKLACDECLAGDHPERCVHMIIYSTMEKCCKI